jgi:hypothetical protein
LDGSRKPGGSIRGVFSAVWTVDGIWNGKCFFTRLQRGSSLPEFTNSKYNSPVISSTFGLVLALLGESVTSCYLGVASSVAALVLNHELDPSCISFHAGPRSSSSDYCDYSSGIFMPGAFNGTFPYCESCWSGKSIQPILYDFFACSGTGLNLSFLELYTGPAEIGSMSDIPQWNSTLINNGNTALVPWFLMALFLCISIIS